MNISKKLKTINYKNNNSKPFEKKIKINFLYFKKL